MTLHISPVTSRTLTPCFPTRLYNLPPIILFHSFYSFTPPLPPRRYPPKRRSLMSLHTCRVTSLILTSCYPTRPYNLPVLLIPFHSLYPIVRSLHPRRYPLFSPTCHRFIIPIIIREQKRRIIRSQKGIGVSLPVPSIISNLVPFLFFIVGFGGRPRPVLFK